jgi:hypothetical protein
MYLIAIPLPKSLCERDIICVFSNLPPVFRGKGRLYNGLDAEWSARVAGQRKLGGGAGGLEGFKLLLHCNTVIRILRNREY